MISAVEKLRFRSIRVKITFWASLCMFTAAAIVITYAALKFRSTAIQSAEEHAAATASSHATRIETTIEAALDTPRTLAQALAASRLGLSRAQVNAMLRQILVENPQFASVYTLWEPDAFDGQDAHYAGAAGHDGTGRFVPCWWWGATGQPVAAPAVGYEMEGTGDYYQIPKRTRQEYISSLHIHSVRGRSEWVISLTTPIVVDGQFHGVAGVDLRLESLRELVEEGLPADGSQQVALISHDGILAMATGHPEMTGERARVLYSDADGRRRFDEYIRRLQAGEQRIIVLAGTEVEVYDYVNLDRAATPWFVRLIISQHEMAARGGALARQVITLGAAMSILTLVALWVVAGRVVWPINCLTHAARSVAQGDLTVEADVQTWDEIGVLATVFNQMVSRLRDMLRNEREQRERLQARVQEYVAHMMSVTHGDLTAHLDVDGGDGRAESDPLDLLGIQLNETTLSLQRMIAQIRDAAQRLNTAAAEILSVATQQASGANQQSAAIAQTTTTVDELKTLAEQTAVRAREVAEAARRTVEISYTGQRAVDEAVGGMAQIRARVEGIAGHILALAERTQQIGGIIAAVNELAAQSNMLALNAGMEAARAGEAGRGFAAVAVEVRRLAEQSQQATAQVRAILADIQKATQAAVTATEEGTRGVTEGVRLAEEAGDSIERLAQVIEESAQAAAQLMAGGRQQATGVEQVAMAMQSINQATLQGLAGTRQAEKAAHALSQLARSLAETVEAYRL